MAGLHMTAEGPLVSIGIPVYNGEDSIGNALDNLLMQTYDNLELIISDNASTDRTAEICLEYASRDRRIKFYRNHVNVGVYANYRRVLTLSKGEYFMWATDDDIKPPNIVEHCVNALTRNPRAVLAHGMVLVRVPGTDKLFEIPNIVQATDTNAAARIRLFTRGITHNAMLYGLYRLNAIKRATFGNHMGQYYLVCLQMCLLGAIEYIGTPLIVFSQPPLAFGGDPREGNPMYGELPLTLRNLVNVNKLQKRKCWTVLTMGIYYLATRRGVAFTERLSAIAAHATSFCFLFRRLLR